MIAISRSVNLKNSRLDGVSNLGRSQRQSDPSMDFIFCFPIIQSVAQDADPAGKTLGNIPDTPDA